MLNLIWNLRYFYLCLGCDCPILEALHFTWDRVEVEFCNIFPALHAQLTDWGYNFVRDPNPFWTHFRLRESRTCSAFRAALIGFSVTMNSNAQIFSFEIDYPNNGYQVTRHEFAQTVEGLGQKRIGVCYSSRGFWMNQMVAQLAPKLPALPPKVADEIFVS
jgi:hypothetical protein